MPTPTNSAAERTDGAVRGQYDQLVAECRAAFAEKRFADAEKACRRAVAADPGVAATHLLLAHALSNLGRWKEAVAEATEASKLRPDWADPFAVIGGAQQQLGNPMPATHAYQRYLELAPKGSYADDIRSSLDQLPTTEFPPGTPLVLAATVTRHGPQDADSRPDSGADTKWRSATVFVDMPRAVDKGDRITVIPVRSGIPSLDLTVTSSKAQLETELTPAIWLVEAETVEGLFLSAPPDKGAAEDTPFEAVVVYPAHPGATLLSRQAVRADLPKVPGASSRTLWSAIDIDGDGRADAEIFRFCCDNPAKASSNHGPSPCDSDCATTFVHPSGRPWTLVDRSSED